MLRGPGLWQERREAQGTKEEGIYLGGVERELECCLVVGE